MPRRLGDDPLSRKKSSFKAEGDPSALPASPVQQTSHNDVFFRRRTEGPQPTPEGTPGQQRPSLGEGTNVDERPEITEVSDIMRTASVAKSTQGAEQLARPAPVGEPAHPPAEEPVETIGQTPPVISEPVPALEPSHQATEEPAAPTSSQPQPEPKKNEGFLKRLFGRLGK